MDWRMATGECTFSIRSSTVLIGSKFLESLVTCNLNVLINLGHWKAVDHCALHFKTTHVLYESKLYKNSI
jgi:hypothetical protein